MKIDGVQVIDAKKKLAFEISQDDVKRGANKEPGSCAAARACLRQVKGVEEARVHLSRVYLKVKDKGAVKWVRHMTPDSLRSEIISFDRGGRFAPGKYILQLVQKSTRFGAPKRKRFDDSKGPRHGKASKRSKPHRVANVRASAVVRGGGSNRATA